MFPLRLKLKDFSTSFNIRSGGLQRIEVEKEIGGEYQNFKL
jgi:hypothetical protein